MKKITAFLLVLTLLAGVTAAFAETPSKEDVVDIIVEEGDLLIVWVNDPNPGDEEFVTPPVENSIYEAQKNGSALDVLPKEIRDQLPEGFTKVNEIGSMKLDGNMDSLADVEDVKAIIKFDTPYAEGEVVYLAIGIPGDEGTEWVLLKGVANEDHNVKVTFDGDTLRKIGTKTFGVMAISAE